MSTVTIEAIDLADYDWTPVCEVQSIEWVDGKTLREYPCGNPAVYVIEVRHCTWYRLFACYRCAHGRTRNGWICRSCNEPCSAPLTIGKAS